MRFSILRYYVNDYRNRGRISIRCWIHKRHPIPRPYGQAMGVSFVNICEKIHRVIKALHCTVVYRHRYIFTNRNVDFTYSCTSMDKTVLKLPDMKLCSVNVLELKRGVCTFGLDNVTSGVLLVKCIMFTGLNVGPNQIVFAE